MSKTAEPPRILAIHEAGDVTHYRVSTGQEGGQGVTVRIGITGVLACMTCYSKDCIHVRTVQAAA